MGLKPDMNGFCVCPFHQEKTASMKLYKGNRGFHCFGCGATGDVINLVMRYYGLNFKQALLKLDCEWGLGLNLVGRPLSRREQLAAERRQWRRAMIRYGDECWQKAALELYYAACKLEGDILRMIRENAPEGPETPFNDAFIWGLQYSAEVHELASELATMAIGGDDG